MCNLQPLVPAGALFTRARIPPPLCACSSDHQLRKLNKTEKAIRRQKQEERTQNMAKAKAQRAKALKQSSEASDRWRQSKEGAANTRKPANARTRASTVARASKRTPETGDGRPLAEPARGVPHLARGGNLSAARLEVGYQNEGCAKVNLLAAQPRQLCLQYNNDPFGCVRARYGNRECAYDQSTLTCRRGITFGRPCKT